MRSQRTASLRNKPRQRGFTLIEVMVSTIVLTVGLVSLLGVMGLAMAATQTSGQQALAKQLSDEVMESILTARETANITWAQIQNSGAGGIFLDGMQPMYNSGADGIYGTTDDSSAGMQTLQQAGPDGIFGTADDVFLPLNNFQRQVQIGNVYDNAGNLVGNLRSVTITIQYYSPRFRVPQTYVLNTFISQYR